MKDTLLSYRYIIREIDSLLLQREELMALASKITSAISQDQGGGVTEKRKIEEWAIKIANLDREIEIKAEQLSGAAEDIRRLIDLLPEGKEKSVLSYRYINGLSIQQTAEKMHYSFDHTWRLQNRGLRALCEVDEK